MADQVVLRDYPQVTAGEKISFYIGMVIKAFVFFTIVGFITYPAWKGLYDHFNFWNIPLWGVIVVFGLILFFVALGIVYSILSRIISLFTPKKS